MIRLFLTCIFGIGVSFASGQTPEFDRLKEEITYHADITLNATKSEHRLRAHDLMVTALDSFLHLPGSFHVQLDSIPWISIVKGDDFRIITWQLRISDDEYKYGGRIQGENRVVSLSDSRPFVNGANRMTFTPSMWYGCIYYQILPFERDHVKYYMLLGFNAENGLLNTKVVDVLDFTSGQPVFGVPVFMHPEGPQTRVILTYADVSALYLAFDDEVNGIVHSHLANMPGVGPQGEVLPVSDGSLEAWLFKKGNWIYEEEIYDVKVKDPPMTDERKDRKEDKDILGRPIKG